MFGNKTVDDILLRSELDSLAAKHKDRFELLYSVDHKPEREEQGRGIGHFGRIDAETLTFLFSPADEHKEAKVKHQETIALVCGEHRWTFIGGRNRFDRRASLSGPPPMIEKGVYPALEKLGFQPDRNLWSF